MAVTEYDGTDVYAVENRGEAAAIVKHYPRAQAPESCCCVEVEMTDEDRVQAAATDLPARFYMLQRAHREIEKRHGRAQEKTA